LVAIASPVGAEFVAAVGELEPLADVSAELQATSADTAIAASVLGKGKEKFMGK